jgi:hypothetical protein
MGANGSGREARKRWAKSRIAGLALSDVVLGEIEAQSGSLCNKRHHRAGATLRTGKGEARAILVSLLKSCQVHTVGQELNMIL